MTKPLAHSRLLALSLLALIAVAAVWTRQAIADSSSDESRIDARLTKDAGDHLKSNLADDTKKDALKTELRRAEALRQMAETLAKDPGFEQSYGTLLKASQKRMDSTMPSQAEVIQEKEKIINDADATRTVMAEALLILQSRDAGHR